MRFAERKKRLQQLTKRTYTTRLEIAEVTTANDGSAQLALSPGLSVIAGGNGAGKSTLLGAIWRCISGQATPADSQFIPPPPPWMRNLRVIGFHDGIQFSRSYDVSGDTDGDKVSLPIFYIDPAADTEDMLRTIRADAQAADLLEGLDPAPLPQDQVEMLSYILRRDYSEILVYEITAFSADDTPMPYFEVKSMGKNYSLPQMGRGELSATYLLWRLDSVPSGSIVLLEEPECHLAAFSQELLVDAVVDLVVDKDLCVIASTHSPGFFEKLPPRHVSLVSSLPAPLLRSDLPVGQIASHMGVHPRITTLALLEDQVAADFLFAIISILDRNMLRHVDIRSVDTGESGVRRVLREVREGGPNSIVVLGVLDGDQRTSSGDSGVDNIGYLPGTTAPEDILRLVLERWRRGDFPGWTPSLPGGSSALKLCLERLEGQDLHDWMHGLAAEFGGSRTIALVVVDLLIQDRALYQQCVETVDWIRKRGKLPL
ncbi:AAA family ATPase [Nonomuraea wenchangensis]